MQAVSRSFDATQVRLSQSPDPQALARTQSTDLLCQNRSSVDSNEGDGAANDLP